MCKVRARLLHSEFLQAFSQERHTSSSAKQHCDSNRINKKMKRCNLENSSRFVGQEKSSVNRKENLEASMKRNLKDQNQKACLNDEISQRSPLAFPRTPSQAAHKPFVTAVKKAIERAPRNCHEEFTSKQKWVDAAEDNNSKSARKHTTDCKSGNSDKKNAPSYATQSSSTAGKNDFVVLESSVDDESTGESDVLGGLSQMETPTRGANGKKASTTESIEANETEFRIREKDEGNKNDGRSEVSAKSATMQNECKVCFIKQIQ